MGKIKKIIAGVLVMAVAGTGITAGLLRLKKNNEKAVMVTNVSNLIQEYYMPSTTLEGNVTTSVSQNVSLDKDLIVDQVYVAKGDQVKVGDPLVSFDTTLVEMELNIAKLKHQKLEQDLNKAVNRLNSLKNGGPIVEDGDSPYNADNLNQPDDLYSYNSDDEMTSTAGYIAGNYLAAAFPKLLLAAFSDSDEYTEESTATSENDSQYDTKAQQENEEGPQYQNPSAGEFSSEEDIISDDGEDGFDSGEMNDSPHPSPTPTPQLPDWIDYYDPYYTDGIIGITDGEYEFYEKLDASSLPLTGKGTKEDPFIFLCSSKNGAVTILGSFFNKMAGYSEDGSRVEKEGGYWYQLEFHESDILMDYRDRKQSCTGYYLIDGSLLEKPVNMHTETDFTLAEASRYEDEIPNEPAGPGTDANTSTISRAEAIKIQQNKIASLKLDIQESSIKITKLEKKANKKLISSKLDGTVDYVGDSSSGSTSNSFIKVKSGEGFFVIGTVSELMLDEVTEGTKLNCVSYQSGNFQAEVIDVSEYPVSGNSYFGDSNPNVSYYTYTATVSDDSVELQDQDYLTITLESASSGSGTLVLQKAFVRTENGKSYVYKDDNGVLKKQELSVGATVDGGYSIMVKGGLTSEDKIAFPYGKDVKEGMKTKEVGMDEMYGY